MKTSSKKNKGRNLQQEIVKMMLEVTGLEDEDITSTSMGAPGRDIKKSSRAYEVLPIVEECKSRANIAVYEYYEQAISHLTEKDYKEQREPVVFIKQNRSKPLALVDARYLVRILNALTCYTNIKELP